MPIWDHRVFRHGKEWWVSEVHLASGGGWGDGPHPISSERVFFTSLTDEKEPTRSAQIPPRKLNKMSHRSLVRLLENATPTETRMAMNPYNAPPKEFDPEEVFTDEEGLRWIAFSTEIVADSPDGPVRHPAIELVCLDDSAMRKEVRSSDDTVLPDAINQLGKDLLTQELIRAVKDLFEDIRGHPD